MKIIKHNGVTIAEREWLEVLKKTNPEGYGLPKGFDEPILKMMEGKNDRFDRNSW